jgi:mono/diheme cytochrome c family protein
MRWALAIGSFIVLLVHGIILYEHFTPRWERNQFAYFDQSRGLAKTDTERAAMQGRSPRIEQIQVTQFGEKRVDRCTTCHIAVDDPRFASYAEPVKTHPYSEALGDRQRNGRWERRHKFSDFGCTVCHDGQGRGLTAYYAHGEDEFWTLPMLGYTVQENWRKEFQPHLKGTEYMQANCALCHTEENFAGTPLVTRGRRLFFEKGCYGCHRIAGLSNGTLGPDLSEVGKKWKLDYLWESIVDPRANSAVSFMPLFKLTDDDVKALTIFLKSRRGVNFAETSIDRYRAHLSGVSLTSTGAPAKADVSPARGAQLIAQRACTACHRIGDKDGQIAPDLSYEGTIRDPQWLMEHFRDPRSRVPDSIMPSFNLPADEFQAMTNYLVSLKTPPPATLTPAELYGRLCARCHGEKGNGEGVTMLYLDPAPRDLTKAAFMNSKPEARFVQSIQEGIPGTSMPPWGRTLNDTQIHNLLGYIWQNFVKEPRKEIKEHKVPDTNPVALSEDSLHRGETIFLQRCTGCHGRKADGKGPNSLDISPRPRNLRNAAFIQKASDKRLFDSILYGVQGSAMPPWIDYGLTQNEVGDVVNYIRSLNQAKQ